MFVRILSVVLALTFLTVKGDVIPVLPSIPVEGDGGPGCKCMPFDECFGTKNPRSEGTSVTEKSFSLINERCDNPLEVCCKNVPKVELPVPNVENETEFKECGFHQSSGDKSGNSDSKIEEFPWIVAITSEISANKEETKSPSEPSYEYLCGGSLIHPKAVLTGAHCVFDKTKYQLKVRAGSSDGDTSSYQERRVSEIIEHEDYDNETRQNDIAVLILDEPVNPAENVGLVCLPQKGILPDIGTKCTATGWIKNSNGNLGEIPSAPRKLEVTVIENDKCENELQNITKFGHRFRLHDSLFCAENENEMDLIKDGGSIPMVCSLSEHPGRYIQSGVSAQLVERIDTVLPGIFVNVANFREWVDTLMKERNMDSSSYSY